MRIPKSTAIILNLVFVLVLAVLLKSFFTVPKILSAQDNQKYLSADLSFEAFSAYKQNKDDSNYSYQDFLGDRINALAQDGWRPILALEANHLIFEKR